MGVSALVDAVNNPVTGGATENSVLGPFYTEDAADGESQVITVHVRIVNGVSVDFGESIASEGKGDYMYVEGRISTTEGQPIPNALIETWETDAHG